MADPPRHHWPTSRQRRAAGPAGILNEEKEPVWEEARSSDLPSESEAESEFTSVDSDLSMSAEELDEDDLLDEEEEYQKDIAIQRREDEKIGHYLEAEPLPLGLPANAKVEDDGRLHSLSEIEEMKNKFIGRMEEYVLHADEEHRKENPVKSSPATQKQAAAYVGRRSARVSARVAAFEAHLSTRVSDASLLDGTVDDGGKRGSAAFVSKNAKANLPGNHSLNAICLGKTESRRKTNVQGWEKNLSHSKKDATASVHLGGSADYGMNTNNTPLAAKSDHSKKETDPINASPNIATLQPPSEVNSLLLKGISSNPCLGSGEKAGAIIREDLERVECDVSHANQPNTLNQSPRGNKIDTSQLYVPDVAPLASFSSDEACNMDLVEAQPLLRRNLQHVTTVRPQMSGLNLIFMENQERPVSDSLPPAQVLIPSAFSPFKPNSPFFNFSRPISPNPPPAHHSYMNPWPNFPSHISNFNIYPLKPNSNSLHPNFYPSQPISNIQQTQTQKLDPTFHRIKIKIPNTHFS